MALTKPRIIELLLVTTLPTMVVAARGLPSWSLMAATARRRDAGRGRGQRHQHGRRPRHRRRHAADPRTAAGDRRGHPPAAALVFAVALEVVAFGELWVAVNLLSAVLAVSATLFYVFVYTLWLKRTSRQNIVIGGAAGAVPVLVGWAAVRGTVGWAPVVLFALMFVWTPAALLGAGDPVPGGLPVGQGADDAGRHQLQAHGGPDPRVLAAGGGGLAGVRAGSPGWGPSTGSARWCSGRCSAPGPRSCGANPSEARAMRLFHWSITYVTLLFAAMAVDQLIFH